MNRCHTQQIANNQFTQLRCVVFSAMLVCLVLSGCTNDEAASTEDQPKNEVTNLEAKSDSSNEKSDAKPVKDLPVVNNPDFHESLVEATEAYLRYPMVNSVAEVAPADCAAPFDPEAKPKLSHSDDESSHGNKLYYLFAKDITHYLAPNDHDAPVGQTLVKESWTSKTSNPDARNLRNHASGNRINPRVDLDGKILEIGKRNDLFVMMKLDPKTAGTDQGWVYGVVDPDTKKVTASGKVASCMECHESAKHDRLFGADLAGLE